MRGTTEKSMCRMVGRMEDKELYFGAKVGMKGEEECPLIFVD